jgi:hypothetical protein
MTELSALMTPAFGKNERVFDVAQCLGNRFADRLRRGRNRQFGTEWRLVGCRDTRKINKRAGACLLVQPLRIALLAGLQIGFYKDLVKLFTCCAPRSCPVRAIR